MYCRRDLNSFHRMIKHQLVAAARTVGLTDLLADSAWRRRRLLILCYHGISLHDEHEWNPGLYMSPATFERRLQHLRANRYAILPLAEALTRLQAGTLPPRAVSLTFDDGAHDFAEVAVPLLATYDAPATVYLTTHYVQHRYPVLDTGLSYLLWQGRNGGRDLAALVPGAPPLLVATPEQRASTWKLLRTWANDHLPHSDAKNNFLRTVAETLGTTNDTLLWTKKLLHIMSEEQVRTLPTSIAVELHTHRHRTPRDREAFQQELQINREHIHALRPHAPSPTHFCYPSGNYSRHFLPWMDEMQVTSATTCVPGLTTRASHPLLLPRFVDTTTQTLATFDAWCSGIAEFLPRRTRYQLDPSRD
jgi:peptidoglycan/xylan/chitin deacetylase (PgdA/CDA1 family)